MRLFSFKKSCISLYWTRVGFQHFGGAKAPGLANRKSAHIINVERLEIGQLREFSRCPTIENQLLSGIAHISHKLSGNLDNLSRYVHPQMPSLFLFDNVLGHLRKNVTQHLAQLPPRFFKKCGLALAFLSLSLLFGCGREVLSAYTDYVSHENLASYHVNTPDPSLNNPPFGQRLIVSWALPKDKPKADAFQLSIIIRFCNREEIVKCLSLRKPIGTYLFSLLNEKYCEKGGILTYKIQLLEEGRLIEERRHQLWAELIIFENGDDVR